jgi:hypothetical protein
MTINHSVVIGNRMSVSMPLSSSGVLLMHVYDKYQAKVQAAGGTVHL